MYAAFNVKVDQATVEAMGKVQTFRKYLTEADGAAPPARARPSVGKALASMLDPDGTVNAERMREEWFPGVSRHVFLSHSHADKPLADAFVQVLQSRFGITCFVDADVWGYIGDLQREIDNKWCKGSDGKSFDYKKLQASTAHVHMLLLSALAKMMDNCECLMFLNTPASVPVRTVAESNSYSSWIYGEAALSSIIRRRPLKEHRPSIVTAKMESFEEAPRFKYVLPLNHMVELGKDRLFAWGEQKSTGPTGALDKLYELSGVKD